MDAPIAYVSHQIDEAWVNDGAEAYALYPPDFKKPMEAIFPSDMSVDFFVGVTHAASSSAVGARVCHVIKEKQATAEFVEKLNALSTRLNKEGY